MSQIDEFIGKKFVKITNSGIELIFDTDGGETFKMYHEQDCCESVFIDDICGDLDDLINTPILHADEETNSERVDYRIKELKESNPNLTDEEITTYLALIGSKRIFYDDSFTWTFYRFRTQKGSVVIRWYGSSNGYYSESVSVVKIK